MILRYHPLMSYHSVPNWPPAWLWIDGRESQRPEGEIGILREVILSNVQPANRCFLRIDHEGSSYMGCLLFDDTVFCGQIAKLLESYCNRPIVEVGSVDLSYFF
jgi:hypothetical protein